jgi:uracil-DNA glycosylase family 4
MDSVLIVDGNSLMYRAAYAFGTGNYGVVHGIMSYLSSVIQKYTPEGLVICWDIGKSRWRKQIFPEYKAGRKEKKDIDFEEVIRQARQVSTYFSFNKVPQLAVEGVEADDLISWVSDYYTKVLDCEVIISTGDRDLWQLVGNKVFVYDHLKDILVDRNVVLERFGVLPELLPDLRALSGDSSDNIEGVKGVGDKTALSLIKEYGNLGTLLSSRNKTKLLKSRRTAKVLTSDSVDLAYRLMKLSDLKSAKYYLSEDECRMLVSALLQPERCSGMDFQALVDQVGGSFISDTDFSQYSSEEGLAGMAPFFESLPQEFFALVDVDRSILVCDKCELRSHCGEFGPTLSEGYTDAEIMLVGRNPGQDELKGGKPFIGRAGKRLDKMLEEVGLTRRDCWITNVNKCYSSNNRPTTYGEILACAPYLRAEVDLIKPKLIVTFGNEAMSLFTPYGSSGVTKRCGEILERPEGLLGPVDARVAVCVHPSMALRSPTGEVHMKYATEKLREFLEARRADIPF